MASKSQERASRQARQRLRDYEARQALHRYRIGRRVRDNVVGVVILVLVCTLAVVAQVFYFSGGPGTPVPTPSATATSGGVPSPDVAQGREWTGSMTLNNVNLGIQLDGAAAPQGVSVFVTLAQEGFYNGLTCHRLTTSGIFVLQCGDPKGDGSGGPGYSWGPVENAPADNVYPAGTIAVARQSGNANSMGSQFFIVYQDSTIPADAAGGYTVLGQVTSGLDQLDAQIIAAGTGSDGVKPAVPTTINAITVQ